MKKNIYWKSVKEKEKRYNRYIEELMEKRRTKRK